MYIPNPDTLKYSVAWNYSKWMIGFEAKNM